MAKGRNKHFAPKKRIQTRKCQQDERASQKPLTDALQGLETLNLEAGFFAVNRDAATDETKCS